MRPPDLPGGNVSFRPPPTPGLITRFNEAAGFTRRKLKMLDVADLDGPYLLQ